MAHAVPHPPTDSLREEYASRVESSIADLYQFIKVQMREVATRYHPDLQPVGYGILRSSFDGPVRASEIAHHLGMDKGAVSRQITQLREMGLLETRQDPDDGRATLLVASERAHAVRDEFRLEMTSGYGRLFTDWSTEDMCSLARLMGNLNDSMVTRLRK
jgi:DNA-binding MarR family transcriptional regulator